MFKEIISHKGFWRSVLTLGVAFVVIFLLLKWALDGFSASFFSDRDPLLLIFGSLGAGLVYGFVVTFGKFRAKLKNKEPRK